MKVMKIMFRLTGLVKAAPNKLTEMLKKIKKGTHHNFMHETSLFAKC